MEYSDLASLEAGECFILLPEPQVRIVKLQTPEVKPPNKNVGFIQSENLAIEPQIQDLEQDIADTDKENNDLDEADDRKESEHGSSKSLDEAEQQKKGRDLDVGHSIIKH